MRNMSFSMTTQQVRDRTKDVTRRKGWVNLKPGDRFWACVKCQGLKRGEKIERIALCEVVSNTKGPLSELTQSEVDREGFPNLTPDQFADMFRRSIGEENPNRIEFKYIYVRTTI